MNFWYVNMGNIKLENDSFDLKQAPALAEQNQLYSASGKSWESLTKQEQLDIIGQTPVPIVHLLKIGPPVQKKRWWHLFTKKQPLPDQVRLMSQEMQYGDSVFTWLGGDSFQIASVVGDYQVDERSLNTEPHEIPIFWSDKVMSNSDASAILGAAAANTNKNLRIVSMTLDEVRPMLYQAMFYQWSKSLGEEINA